jgi:hypothetical protein
MHRGSARGGSVENNERKCAGDRGHKARANAVYFI